MAKPEMTDEEVNEAVDSLLEKGIIVCVGHNELGREIYTTLENAKLNNMKIIPSEEKRVRRNEH